MDLVTAEDWCGMLGGGGVYIVCACVLCVMCMLGMSASPPSEPENTHRWGRRRKCGDDEKEIQKEKRLLLVYPRTRTRTGTLIMPLGSVVSFTEAVHKRFASTSQELNKYLLHLDR